MATLGLDRY